MRAVAEEAAAAEHERIGRAETVAGVPARPLSVSYARQKLRLGLPAIRDWSLTGEALAGLRVQDARDGSATVGMDSTGSAKMVRLAQWNSQYDQMIGLSEADQVRVLGVQERIYAEKNERRGE